MDVANLHVALAIKNCRYLELPYPDGATFGIKNPLKIDNEGYVQAPSEPGLGVDIDWNIINKNSVVRIWKWLSIDPEWFESISFGDLQNV